MLQETYVPNYSKYYKKKIIYLIRVYSLRSVFLYFAQTRLKHNIRWANPTIRIISISIEIIASKILFTPMCVISMDIFTSNILSVGHNFQEDFSQVLFSFYFHFWIVLLVTPPGPRMTNLLQFFIQGRI